MSQGFYVDKRRGDENMLPSETKQLIPEDKLSIRTSY